MMREALLVYWVLLVNSIRCVISKLGYEEGVFFRMGWMSWENMKLRCRPGIICS